MNHCADCFYFVRLTEDEGECHGGTPEPVLHALSDVSRRVSWPLVYDNAGCAAWQPDPLSQKTDADLRLEVVARALGLRDSATVEEIVERIDGRNKILDILTKRVAELGKSRREQQIARDEGCLLVQPTHQPDQVFGSLPVDPKEEE